MTNTAAEPQAVDEAGSFANVIEVFTNAVRDADPENKRRFMWPRFIGGSMADRLIPVELIEQMSPIVVSKTAIEAGQPMPGKPGFEEYRRHSVMARGSRSMIEGWVCSAVAYSEGALCDRVFSAAMAHGRALFLPQDATDVQFAAFYVCERCGQPMGKGGKCNSGLHVGPDEDANGEAILTTEMAERLQRAESEVERFRR